MTMPATAVPTTTPPPLTAETPPPESQPALIKEEPQDPAAEAQHETPKSQSSQPQPQPKSQSKQQPPLPTPTATPTPAKSSMPMNELRNLSAAVSAFQNCFNDIQHHLNHLKTAIDNLITPSKNSNILLLPSPNSLQESSPPPIVTATTANTDTPTRIAETQSTGPTNEKIEHVSTQSTAAGAIEQEADVKPSNSSSVELKTLCETMNSKGLRRYLVTDLKEINRLREEVPRALKLAPNPARLVLDCSGRFFLQGSKAYVKNSPMVTGREASVLVLECFLLMGIEENAVQIEKSVKDEADQAAVLWRKRMVNEGGILKACKIDARGLLMFIGCFGVPPTFKNDDLRDLLRVSYIREIAGTLRKSSILVAKVPEIVEGMIKQKMEVDAVNIIYTFGLEDKFNPQTILTSFLQESQESLKKGRKTSQASPAAVNDANKKQLGILKSMIKCLEGHKIDPSNILSEWQVNEKISSLEKDIAEFAKKRGEDKPQKRKAGAEPGRKSKPQEVKRSRYTGQGLQQQKVVGHDSQRNKLGSGIPGHVNGYSVSQSMMHAPVAGTDPYAGVYGGVLVDQAGHAINHNVQPYGWHGDPTLSERVAAHSYASQPSAHAYAGQPSSHAYAGQPSSSMSSLYRPSPSMDGYAMHPSGTSVVIPSRNTASDLYQFADAVVENEYHPPVVTAHHTSYMY